MFAATGACTLLSACLGTAYRHDTRVETVWTVAWSGDPSAGISDPTSLPEMKSSSRCGAISAFAVPSVEAGVQYLDLGASRQERSQ
jgi:hypothetical protein